MDRYNILIMGMKPRQNKLSMTDIRLLKRRGFTNMQIAKILNVPKEKIDKEISFQERLRASSGVF